MKKFLITLLVFSILLITGCDSLVKYKFLNEESEIQRIEIVSIDEFNDEGECVTTTICEISDNKEFISDFRTVDCHDQWTHPLGVGEGENAIKIIYENGEYELISANGMAEFTNDHGFRNYVGFNWFDEEQFEDLIEKYTVVDE